MVKVAFLWHMHQPSYRDPLAGSFMLPWVRLHALKDYLGMVRTLRETPGVRATFNLVPCLLDQIEAYARAEALEPLQELSLKPAEKLGLEDKRLALRSFFMAHRDNLIGRFPRFLELLERRGPRGDELSLLAATQRFGTQDYRDLQVLSKLAWFDPDWRAADPVVSALEAKGRDFEEGDKWRLAERERALIGEVIPAYRQAAESGQVELSTSPYYHPMLPLLCDSEAHHEAHPGAPLPRRFRHPEDAADQVRRAIERHSALFGQPPRGVWPPEGGLSEETVGVLAGAGVSWTASDESVLERSIGRPLHRDSRGTARPLEVLYRPWKRLTPSGELGILFRDRALSDLIGFSYGGIEPGQAAADLLERLRRIGESWRAARHAGDPVVGIALDGENAWEHFRDGGRVFLRALYHGIEEDEGLQAVTMSEAVAGEPCGELPRVFAGSWVDADFSIWIGHADDRRAWDLLGQAREAIVAAEASGEVGGEHVARAWETYRSACGSDWCWWYGEEHSSENVVEFDRLFRRHLTAIYEAIGQPPPAVLGETLISTRVVPARHSRPTGRVEPVIDGRLSSPEEWLHAGTYRVAAGRVTLHPGFPEVRTIRFGVGGERLSVLLETARAPRELIAETDLILHFPGPTELRYRAQGSAEGIVLRRAERTGVGWIAAGTKAEAAAGDVIEASIPLSELRPGAGHGVQFKVIVAKGGVERERHPEGRPIEVDLDAVTRD